MSTSATATSNPFNASPRRSTANVKNSPKLLPAHNQAKLSPRRVFSPLLTSVSPSTTVKGDNNIRLGSKPLSYMDEKVAQSAKSSAMHSEKHDGKKGTLLSSGTTSKSKSELGQFADPAAIPHAKRQSRCSNAFCLSEKQRENGAIPANMSANVTLKQIRSKKIGETYQFCEPCYARYLEKHFCNFCEQIYDDDSNVDDKEWIQCDSCDLWNHLDCEEEKIKKQLKNQTEEKYDCLRCRLKDTSSSLAISTQKAKKLLKQVTANQRKNAEALNQGGEAKKNKLEKLQEKKKHKMDKNQPVFEEPKSGRAAADSATNKRASPLNHNMLSVAQIGHKQVSNSMSASSRDISTPRKNTPSTMEDNANHHKVNANDWTYSLDNYLGNKRVCNQSRQTATMQITTRQVQPNPHFPPFDELQKIQGLPLYLPESEIQIDLQKLRELSKQDNQDAAIILEGATAN